MGGSPRVIDASETDVRHGIANFRYIPRILSIYRCTMSSSIKIDWSKVDQPDLVLTPFPSRRSVVYGTKGVIASSQPLATEAGLEILRKGGNAGMRYDFNVRQLMLISHFVTNSGCCGSHISCFECHRAKLLWYWRVSSCQTSLQTYLTSVF